MRRKVQLFVFLALILTLFFARQATAEPRGDQCVILVSIDGLAQFYLDDAKAYMPTIRRLAREGARADGMVTSFPSVTWPAHTALATGAPPAKNGMVGNSYLDRATAKPVTLLCDPVYDKDQVVKVPMILDVVHQAGLKTAAICWPATRNARSLDWMVPDMPADGWEKYGTKSWMDELRAAALPIDSHGAWCAEPSGGVERDWMYVRMAAQVLREHKPNLLMIHLVEPDHTQHRYGPRSPEAYWCASYADDCIRNLVGAIRQSPWNGKTTLFVCSDHGFLRVRHEIRPNVVLRKLGLVEPKGGKSAQPAAYCLSQGGASGVYVLDDARRAEITAQLKEALGKLPGVEAVLAGDQAARLGQPSAEENPWAPDFWLAARPEYTFSDSSSGDDAVVEKEKITGTHGYLPDQPDMLAMCVARGPGIKPGTKLGKITSTQIAPTIAQIFGLAMPTAEGKPLATVAGR